MEGKMSLELKQAFVIAREYAIKNRDETLKLEHVIYAILISENRVSVILSEEIHDYDLMIVDIDELNKKLSDNSDVDYEAVITFDPILNEVIKKCISSKNKVSEITPELFLIMSLLKKDMAFYKIMSNYGVTKSLLEKGLKKIKLYDMFTRDEDAFSMSEEQKIKSSKTKSKTPIIDAFSRDLIKMASEGNLDEVIGREDEIERVAQILSRRTKNNPILIGEAGVGKTAIAEGLAIKILNGDVPRTLLNKRIMSLDLTTVVAGTKYRGQFEERIKLLLDEARNNKDIILFIDEIHTLIGTGNSSGSLDAANAFKPALARGELQCIGATTFDEYRKNIEKDAALTRRFQKVVIEAPDASKTKQILNNIKNKYEDYHKVSYSDEIVEEIVNLASRYITDRHFPDKAIDIMDELGAKAQISLKPPSKIKELEAVIRGIQQQKLDVIKNQNYEKAADLRDQEKVVSKELEEETLFWKNRIELEKTEITKNMVLDVISKISGVPVNSISENEIEKLLNLENELASKVIGQNEAVEKISSAIKRNKTNIRDKNRPIGVFLFVGPTGVGKTELTKALADATFGNRDAIVRIDMSEYSEKFSSSRLIGAPPGYIGYNEGGELTEKIRKNPYSIILLDEIEKAHPDIYNVFLPIFDEGHATDGLGKKVNFRNTIIIMTSNLGSKESQESGLTIGFSSNNENKAEEAIVEKSIKKFFKPEFLNRLDDIVHFNHLEKSDILKIIELQLKNLSDRLAESGHTMKVKKGVTDKLVEIGYSKEMGARNLSRAIRKELENKMSDLLLKNGLPENYNFNISVKSNKILVE